MTNVTFNLVIFSTALILTYCIGMTYKVYFLIQNLKKLEKQLLDNKIKKLEKELIEKEISQEKEVTRIELQKLRIKHNSFRQQKEIMHFSDPLCPIGLYLNEKDTHDLEKVGLTTVGNMAMLSQNQLIKKAHIGAPRAKRILRALRRE